MNICRSFYKHISYTGLVLFLLCVSSVQKAQAQRKDSTNVNSRGTTRNPQSQAQTKTIQRPIGPKPDDRHPPSEDLAKKKWTIKRKLVQNTVSRYNYYFNAKKKLRLVTHNVSRTGQDNYNYLLPFYPYSAANQGISKGDLDSVIEKASINIQIHDPRSKWMDDSYLLIGKAYFFQGEWDKANRTFNFINTNYLPKKKNEYKSVVGSVEKDQISIASREKRKPPIGWFKHTFARNDAFVWNAKTKIEENNYDEARSIINVLDQDPYFPKRLDGELAEVKAYSLYKQGKFQEAIEPMQIAEHKKVNRDEKARMAYILGQLYTNYNKPDSAIAMYYHVIKTKPDQMMEFQARIAINKLKATMPGGSLEQSLATLAKMAKKEKYQNFRDAIYYTMAQLVLPTDKEAALGYLRESLKASAQSLTPNPMQKALTYKLIADIYYDQRTYRSAKSFYDSTASVMPLEFQDSAVVNKRKKVLTDVAVRIEAIQLQDSLQRIAAMPESDRKIFLTKLSVQIRKDAEENAKKARADSAAALAEAMASANTNNPFSNNGMNTKAGQKAEAGDWYFYNTASKSSGFQEFKRKWGNRGNNDNWRRSQNGVVAVKENLEPVDENGNPISTDGQAKKKATPADSTTAETLAANLPLTPDELLKSNIIAEEAFYDLGKLYSDGLDNLDLGIETYDTLLNRYPHHPNKTEVIYSLYIWHNKLNHTALANSFRQQIMSNYGDSKFASIIRFGGLKDENIGKKKEISSAYEHVYGAYLDCNYETALRMKKEADSTFGLNFMQPKFDLLEAMIIAKMDTCEFGKQPLTAVMNKYQNDDQVYARSKELLDALDNRSALVVYLSMLEIERKPEAPLLDEDVTMIYPWQRPHPELNNAELKTATADSIKLAADNAKLKIAPLPPPMKPKVIYKLVADAPHFVVMSFNKLTKKAVDESVEIFTKYNKEHHPDMKIQVGSYVMSQTEVLLIFRLFDNEDRALDYFDEIRLGAGKLLPQMRPSDYTMFIISRDNFILMNTRRDLDGYKKFFGDNYIIEQ
ncbi:MULTISPECIES: tetratricopeptide repeat protein [unclassified Chitinophaga]|uniref:type IX secretion system periplasmic lipoprotein PorW/SprE n=1 Tax=unclassified Chitinophaga TaxID=2619133 RepID=UPI0009C739F4|nr:MULTISPECIES: tetratricopeptide repeat protein [unclassified Chitinophaga]OMP80319.1 hypothetical protein BW716_05825 [[Flexibacter] sp. ATCC 35208]WPV66882.1 tetratricopeptide repeat protein [Chitinophaga sp. LS1]